MSFLGFYQLLQQQTNTLGKESEKSHISAQLNQLYFPKSLLLNACVLIALWTARRQKADHEPLTDLQVSC